MQVAGPFGISFAGCSAPDFPCEGDAQLSEEDLANLRYLALHRIPEVLEKLTKGLMQDRPANPLEYMTKQLTDMRIATKTKSMEEFIKTNTNNPNFKLSSDAAREMGRRVQERDDSMQSEASSFSINSVDMADFLAEFRQAYAHVTRHHGTGGRLTQAELGEIIDYVALPTPDNMLTDMFSEIDLEKEGSVEFDVFLARMSFKVQNRFSSELLKTLFFSAAADNNVLDAKGVWVIFRKLGFRLSEKEMGDLCARYAANRSVVTVDEFQRIVHVHSATLSTSALTPAFGASNSAADGRYLDDD
eukprot:EG_transcript_16096